MNTLRDMIHGIVDFVEIVVSPSTEELDNSYDIFEVQKLFVGCGHLKMNSLTS